MTSPVLRTGARVLADQLTRQGVNHLFCVPGESFIESLDALADNPAIRVITNRHESASTFMAGAYARLTGQPGVAYVTRGPGACNASIGVQHALLDSLPLILFVGQVGTDIQERQAFQEIDLVGLFRPICKWAVQVQEAARIPELVARAFQIASSGRPGPVVIVLPENILTQETSAIDARCHQPLGGTISDTQMASLRRLLSQAKRPLVIAGGAGWNPAACDNLKAFIEASKLPFVSAFRHQDILDNALVNYVGDAGLCINPKLAHRIETADLILALGVSLDEVMTGGWKRIRAIAPTQIIIHAHADLEELGKVVQAELMLNSGMPQLAARLSMMTPIEEPVWARQLKDARREYLQWQGTLANPDESLPAIKTGVDLRQIMATLRQVLPLNAIVCNGAGNFSTWIHRHFTYHQTGTQLAPASGSMGYAVPAAIAAKLVAPDQTVVCISGDGDFMMSAQELSTAKQYGVSVLFIVCNNQRYGTIRSHQDKRFPGRKHLATQLQNPDFARLCAAHGGFGIQVSDTEDFAAALQQALTFLRASRAPALIELACDPERHSCVSL